jgi:transcriptional regulator with XRE-family HTH domain
MNDCRQLLTKNIKKYRKILEISQMALAERVGCSTTLIGNIEINKRFPSAGNINKIAKALEVKVSELFEVKHPPVSIPPWTVFQPPARQKVSCQD